MTFKKIQAAALELPETSRAMLAQSLLQSLHEEVDETVDQDKLWAEEAARRYRDLQKNPEAGVPAEEVFRKLRASRK